jgi:hypothetical protein
MTFRRATASMTRHQMRQELFELGNVWDEFRKTAEGGGSPGEWMYERTDELRTALRRDRLLARNKKPAFKRGE